MSKYKLTPEQVQVVHHPLGSHALVLAVAGSGKSTTMAHRGFMGVYTERSQKGYYRLPHTNHTQPAGGLFFPTSHGWFTEDIDTPHTGTSKNHIESIKS